MRESKVAAGVTHRIGLFIFLVPLLVALGGCSLFGIATKGNLNELADKQDQDHQQLQAQVAESEKLMDTRVTAVEGKARQFDQDLVRYENEIRAAKLELQSIKYDLDAFERDLESAASDSKRSLDIHHAAIISERDRLRQRMNELDQLILSWQHPGTEPEGTVTPVPGGLIVPEEQQGTNTSSDASSASNETSVWDSKRSSNN